MRVECSTLAEFVAELDAHLEHQKLVEGVPVLQGCIRVSRTNNKLTEEKREVFLHLTTVLIIDEADYLLEARVNCGIDYMDASKEYKGTEFADSYVTGLKSFCESRGLTVRPGIIRI